MTEGRADEPMRSTSPLVLFSFNVILGIPAKIVGLFGIITFFGFGGGFFGSMEAYEPPPLEYRLFGVGIVFIYLCILFFLNRWLIAGSPYKFELRLLAGFGFMIGVFLGYYLI